MFQPEDIKNALEVLQKGGLILFPADTGWFVGGDATKNEVVERICNLRGENDWRTLVVLMENVGLLDRYVNNLPEVAFDLVDLASKPLTVIFHGPKNLASRLSSEKGEVMIRFTREKFSRTLIQRFRRPVVVAPAFAKGTKKPDSFDTIASELIEAVDYVVQYGRKTRHTFPRDSIMKLGAGGEIEILRK